MMSIWFRVKKYSLIVIILASIGIWVYHIVSVANKMNEEVNASLREPPKIDDKMNSELSPILANSKISAGRTSLIVLLAVFAIFILLQLLGLLGSLREQFCMTCTYVILQFAITVIDFIFISFYGTFLWLSASFSVLVLLCALIHLRDLYLISQKALQDSSGTQVERAMDNPDYCEEGPNDVFE